MAAGFWRKALPVGRWMTEAYGLAATSSTAELQLLVLPGNPGNSNFYSCFMQQLHERYGGAADVWAVSQPGHDALNLSQGQLFSLEEQVAHKVALLREHVLAPGRPPAIIVAHSIGAYMVLHAIKQVEREAAAARSASPTDRLVKVVLLMPFMATDWASTKQRALCIAASCGAARLLAGGAGLLGALPVRLQELLVALCHPRAEPHARHGIRLLLGAHSVRNNFALAWHEFKDLDRPADWSLIQRLGSRAAVVVAPNDIWHPVAHYREMCEAVPGVEEYWDASLSHDFCLHSRQSARVAELVQACSAPQLAQLPLQQPGGLPHLASSEDVSVLLDTHSKDSVAVEKAAARAPARAAAKRVAVPA